MGRITPPLNTVADLIRLDPPNAPKMLKALPAGHLHSFLQRAKAQFRSQSDHRHLSFVLWISKADRKDLEMCLESAIKTLLYQSSDPSFDVYTFLNHLSQYPPLSFQIFIEPATLKKYIDIVPRSHAAKVFRLLLKLNIKISENSPLRILTYQLRHGTDAEQYLFETGLLRSERATEKRKETSRNLLIRNYSFKMIDHIISKYSKTENKEKYKEYLDIYAEKLQHRLPDEDEPVRRFYNHLINFSFHTSSLHGIPLIVSDMQKMKVPLDDALLFLFLKHFGRFENLELFKLTVDRIFHLFRVNHQELPPMKINIIINETIRLIYKTTLGLQPKLLVTYFTTFHSKGLGLLNSLGITPLLYENQLSNSLEQSLVPQAAVQPKLKAMPHGSNESLTILYSSLFCFLAEQNQRDPQIVDYLFSQLLKSASEAQHTENHPLSASQLDDGILYQFCKQAQWQNDVGRMEKYYFSFIESQLTYKRVALTSIVELLIESHCKTDLNRAHEWFLESQQLGVAVSAKSLITLIVTSYNAQNLELCHLVYARLLKVHPQSITSEEHALVGIIQELDLAKPPNFQAVQSHIAAENDMLSEEFLSQVDEDFEVPETQPLPQNPYTDEEMMSMSFKLLDEL